jgi:2-keto-4-pentenoate hydratase/2-oxohepta-3-ene-1,7-dioic acid hydratase in catechol pathway
VALAINFPGATGLTETMPEPLVFLKAGTSACGPYDDIVSPFPGINVWGECELALVIGRNNSIYGYAAANDVSADNIEGWDHHLARSKAADTFCPLGPWIDTEYEPRNRRIEGLQNGELIRRGNSDDRLWQDERIVRRLSTWMTLEPWDVILTGAPARVVPRRYLKEGDEFAVRIEGLGELRNRFRVAQPR